MPVAESEIEVPEIDVLDTPFKKLIAGSAALLVLVGGVLALGASRASEQEARLSTAAQAASLRAFAGYGEAQLEMARVAGSDVEARSLRQRAAHARTLASLTGSAAYANDVEGWESSAKTLDELGVAGSGATHFDAVLEVQLELLREPRVEALRADALRESASAWGAKTDRYVLGITLLAVALSLLGLSLTLLDGTRRLAVVPAALIATLAGVVSLVAATQRPSATPERAVRALAQGDLQMGKRKFDAAVESYSEAIRVREDYTQALRARATAHALAGSSETSMYVFTSVDRKHRLRSIADLDRALELSPVPDYLTLVNQGANLFHVRRFADSERLTRQALETNDRLPLAWANLALAQAAQGHAGRARESMAEMVRRTLKRPDPIEQAELFASSRTTLEMLVAMDRSRRPLVKQLQGQLVAAQAELVSPGPSPADADARISGIELTVNGSNLVVSYDGTALPERSRISWIGYGRDEPDDAWQQRKSLVLVRRVLDQETGRRSQQLTDYECPGAGQYRVEGWLDDRLVATAYATVETATKYAYSYDAAAHTSLCRPPGWKVEDDVPGRMRLTAPAPDPGALTVWTVPLPAELLDRPLAEVAGTALDREDSCAGPGAPTSQPSYFVGNVEGVSRLYPTRTDGTTTWCWAGFGADDLLHVVVARFDRAPAARTVMNNIVTRIQFDVRAQ